MKKGCLVLALSLLVPASAHADSLEPGSNSAGKITHISKGVKELGVELGMGIASDTVKGTGTNPDRSTMRLSLVGAPVFRYFVVDNVALGLHLGGIYRSSTAKSGDEETKVTDTGFIGTVTAAYYASLGGGMFVAPTIGGGGFYGNRETKTPTLVNGQPVVMRDTLSGGVVRAGIGLAFYPSSRFNLFARPEAIVYIGSAKPKQEATATGTTASTDSQKFTSIDGGFTCGMSYIF